VLSASVATGEVRLNFEWAGNGGVAKAAPASRAPAKMHGNGKEAYEHQSERSCQWRACTCCRLRSDGIDWAGRVLHAAAAAADEAAARDGNAGFGAGAGAGAAG
jgi:hypothetical protein